MYIPQFVMHLSVMDICAAIVKKAARNMGVQILTFVLISSLLFFIVSPFMDVP